MGNTQSNHSIVPKGQIPNHIGFEDVQYALYQLCRYTRIMKIDSLSKWNEAIFPSIEPYLRMNPPPWILINTLNDDLTSQRCLLPQTLTPTFEEFFMNWCIQQKLQSKISILIYGRNSCDKKAFDKHQELRKLGFNAFLYKGGLFEWLLLQDIYGNGGDSSADESNAISEIQQCLSFDEIEFPTTIQELDLLKYKPDTVFPKLLTNE